MKNQKQEFAELDRALDEFLEKSGRRPLITSAAVLPHHPPYGSVVGGYQ